MVLFGTHVDASGSSGQDVRSETDLRNARITELVLDDMVGVQEADCGPGPSDQLEPLDRPADQDTKTEPAIAADNATEGSVTGVIAPPGTGTSASLLGYRRIKLRNILPNPFRDFTSNPLNEGKLEELLRSIHQTGFWNNILARPVNDTAKVEIAYGHHRLEALRRVHAEDHEVGLVVQELNDEAILKIMAKENMAEWRAGTAFIHETLRATVRAFAEGRVELEPVSCRAKKSDKRYAPSFIAGDDGRPVAIIEKAYTAATIARFLGWTKADDRPKDRVKYGLASLELIELGTVDDKHFADMGSKQVEKEVRKLKRVAARAAKVGAGDTSADRTKTDGSVDGGSDGVDGESSSASTDPSVESTSIATAQGVPESEATSAPEPNRSDVDRLQGEDSASVRKDSGLARAGGVIETTLEPKVNPSTSDAEECNSNESKAGIFGVARTTNQPQGNEPKHLNANEALTTAAGGIGQSPESPPDPIPNAVQAELELMEAGKVTLEKMKHWFPTEEDLVKKWVDQHAQEMLDARMELIHERAS